MSSTAYFSSLENLCEDDEKFLSDIRKPKNLKGVLSYDISIKMNYLHTHLAIRAEVFDVLTLYQAIDEGTIEDHDL